MENIPNIFPNDNDFTSWNEWLEYVEQRLNNRGYHRSFGHFQSDFTYWKSFKINGKKAYQIGVNFYDWVKVSRVNSPMHRIAVSFTIMPLLENRFDLEISKDLTIEKVEVIAVDFYKMIKVFDKMQ